MKSIVTFVLVGQIVLLSCQVQTTKEASESKPNIVYILADDMGWGDLTCYNANSKIPTPNMDKIAAEGIRFTDAHSSSAVCTPTRYGILTGTYSWRSKLKSGVLWGYSPPLIHENQETVASFLQENGYKTACIGKWHLGLPWQQKGEHDPDDIILSRDQVDILQPLGKGGPTDLGFDYFYGIPASLDMDPYCYVENNQPVQLPTDSIAACDRSPDYDKGFWRGGPASTGFHPRDVLPEITEKAVDFIHEASKDKSKPFFLYFPITAPHTPWVPLDEYRGTSGAGKYGDFVVMVDKVVGEIEKALQVNNQKNTIIIITSDNGSHIAFIDKDSNHAANAHWRGQKADIHEGGHRVPFIVRWPDKIKAGSVSDETICLTDLMATVADVLDKDLPENAGIDSYSILPAMLGETENHVREATIHHSMNGMFAIRVGDWKFIEGMGTGGFTQPARVKVNEGEPTGQLYNLKDDPQEQNNLFLERPDKVEELTKKLNEIRNKGNVDHLISEH